MLATNIEGKEVTTIEGLALGDELNPVQQGFSKIRRFNVATVRPE
jgi:aerobic-type carbon monoxide dehydrogenase small subunit (CoxS/CutS family)